MAIQETKIDSSIATSELFPETCPYNVYRKDRNLHGGGVMLLVHKDISHMPIKELVNNSESVWVKVFANKTSHYVASWYRQPGSTSEDFQLFRDQLDHIRNQHKGKKLPSVHVLEDFNFRDIDWPDRLNKSGSALSQSEGQMLIDIMNDHGLEQLVHFPTREKNTLDLLLTSLPGQFLDIHLELRRTIRRRNKTHAKAKKMGSKKLRSKFETLRREIKENVRKQHDLYVNNLVGDVKANPRDFYQYINSQKKKKKKKKK